MYYSHTDWVLKKRKLPLITYSDFGKYFQCFRRQPIDNSKISLTTYGFRNRCSEIIFRASFVILFYKRNFKFIDLSRTHTHNWNTNGVSRRNYYRNETNAYRRRSFRILYILFLVHASYGENDRKTARIKRRRIDNNYDRVKSRNWRYHDRLHGRARIDELLVRTESIMVGERVCPVPV